MEQALKRGQPESKLRSEFPAPNPLGGDRTPTLTAVGFDLLSRLLALDPAQRISAKDALDHDWFWSKAIEPDAYVRAQGLGIPPWTVV